MYWHEEAKKGPFCVGGHSLDVGKQDVYPSWNLLVMILCSEQMSFGESVLMLRTVVEESLFDSVWMGPTGRKVVWRWCNFGLGRKIKGAVLEMVGNDHIHEMGKTSQLFCSCEKVLWCFDEDLRIHCVVSDRTWFYRVIPQLIIHSSVLHTQTHIETSYELFCMAHCEGIDTHMYDDTHKHIQINTLSNEH